ncbi:MAG: hypothetical protein U1F56_04570 [Rubrivivax sp.]
MTGPVPTMRLIGGALTMLVLVAACGAAFAGRPLTVDDANTNEKGAGHVEAWVARAHGATVVNVAPAFAPLDRLELAATLSRDTTNQVNASAVQAKVILTERQDKGCNLGASGGFAHVGSGGGNGKFVNGLFTCNAGDLGSLHLNLGLTKASGEASVKTWGVAFEHELGAVTPHLELFGEKGSKPTVQAGARTEVAKGIQLDGTIGRLDGRSVYSLGVKFQF